MQFRELGFRQLLEKRQRELGSCVCVGLDPLISKLPVCLKKVSKNLGHQVVAWLTEMVRTTAPYASCFKPQSAHYESMNPYGINGRWVLNQVVNFIHEKFPQIPVILDCKRGDISRTQERYAVAHLWQDNVDAMNFNPYMGMDTLSALVKQALPGDGFICLGYTSNKSARETQDVLLQNGQHYWQFILECSMRWAGELGVLDNFGHVMAAAYLDDNKKPFYNHLVQGRKITGERSIYLVPGIGTQEGLLEPTIEHGFAGFGSMMVSSSSAINFASSGEDYAEAAGREAQKMHEAFLNVL